MDAVAVQHEVVRPYIVRDTPRANADAERRRDVVVQDLDVVSEHVQELALEVRLRSRFDVSVEIQVAQDHVAAGHLELPAEGGSATRTAAQGDGVPLRAAGLDGAGSVAG